MNAGTMIEGLLGVIFLVIGLGLLYGAWPFIVAGAILILANVLL